MTVQPHTPRGRAGDWLQVRGIHGETPRRGKIVEVIGASGHERFRVRWDEAHESIVYPADGVSVERHNGRVRARHQ